MSSHAPAGRCDPVVDFERSCRAAVATDVIELPFGAAIITRDLPDVYDQNAVWVRRPFDPSAVVAATEDIAGTAGWGHRTVEVCPPDLADELRPVFTDTGYDEDRQVTMAMTRPPIDDGSDLDAATVDFADQLDLSRAVVAEQPWVQSTETAQHLVERQQRYATHVDVFAVVAPRVRPISRCIVLTDGTTALIDHVGTLSRHRGQGWARAVLTRAVRDAFDGGCDHVGLFADSADWPRTWYSRLGFREIGVVSEFRLWPGG